MRKLSSIPYPALAGVVREQNKTAAIAQIKNCVYDGADMIDLHMSCLEDRSLDVLQAVIAASPLPVLALNYNTTCDWTPIPFTEEERGELFLRAVEAGAAGIDMQGYTFHRPSKTGFCGEDKYSFTKGNPKEIVTDPDVIDRQCQLIEQVHSRGAEVLLSCHPGIQMNCEQVVELAHFLAQRKPDMLKIVTKAENEDDLAESFKTMITLKKELSSPVSYHVNGKAGILSRIINPALGGQIAFCVDRYSESSTMEQLDLRTTKTIIDNIKRIM